MFSTARKTVATFAALGALALGGSAIAGAAQSSSSSTATATPSASQGQPPNGARPAGRHVGANGKQEQALSGDVAAKVKAAALKKVPGATIERVETDVDHGSPYEAHMRKADGTEWDVTLDSAFKVLDKSVDD